MSKKIIIGLSVILITVLGYFFIFNDKGEIKNIVDKKQELNAIVKFIEKFAEDNGAKNFKNEDNIIYFEIEDEKDFSIKTEKIINKVFKDEGKKEVKFYDGEKLILTLNIKYYSLPKLAILIDDVGMNLDVAKDFIDLNVDISFAVLPYLPKSLEATKLLKDNKKSVILHMPMEGSSDRLNKRTEGMLYEDYSYQMIMDKLDLAFDEVGALEGFNNHMGSVFTKNKDKMELLLSYAKNKQLYFIDSNTSPSSKGYEIAKEIGMPTAKCSHFLDNDKDVEAIEKEIKYAVSLAITKGKVLTIGHYHKNMAIAIENSKQFIEESGVKLVFVEEILE